MADAPPPEAAADAAAPLRNGTTEILNELAAVLAGAAGRPPAAATAAKFFVVHVPDAGPPDIECCENLAQVKDHLRELAGRGGWATVFEGRHWRVGVKAGGRVALVEPGAGTVHDVTPDEPVLGDGGDRANGLTRLPGPPAPA
jgi:hypothetical protein